MDLKSYCQEARDKMDALIGHQHHITPITKDKLVQLITDELKALDTQHDWRVRMQEDEEGRLIAAFVPPPWPNVVQVTEVIKPE